MLDEDFLKLCRSGKTRQVEEAIRNSANVNATEIFIWVSWTALICAVYNGHTDVVEILLEYGADVNTNNQKGFTALMYAAYYGRMEIAELLIKYGANVKAKNNRRETALMLAKTNGRTETAQLLRKYGAKHNSLDLV